KKEKCNKEKNQNLTSYQELTTTELNQITGGGWWKDLLHRFNVIEQNNTKGFNQPIQL
ncbi:quorum-sensing system pheromone BlpC, partial [Streptococcus pneumoniae]